MNDPSRAKLISCLASPEGHPVPLLGVSLSGQVFGAHARIVLRQRYRNAEKKPIEAIYTFPTPSDAALVGFAMEAAGRRIEAEVKEREEAFRVYDEAVSAGHGAALLDQERRNVFTASVGNLLPGEETIIEVVYVQELRADEGALRLMIPTLVAPRYIPGADTGDRTGHGGAEPTDRVPDADRITPKIGNVDYGLAMDLVFDLGREVTIESPSHSIVETREEGYRQRVSFRQSEVRLDRDLVLGAAGVAGVAAGVVADRRSGDGTFALTVVPDLFDPKYRVPAHDVVFVVDVSGSMDGESITQARSALRLCLRHLAEGDRFNVIAFSSNYSAYRPAPVPFTQRTLEEADRWVAALQANGGTEMLEPLLAAVAAVNQGEGRDRIVVLLTDGQVGNEAEIVAQVSAKAGKTRIYTFGIGTNVSDLLLKDLARKTRAAAEFIHPGERIDEKVTAQFARAMAPRVTDLSLSFVNLDAGERAPAELPDLVDGEPWVVYGRYSEAGMGRAELRGSFRGERFFLEVPIELPVKAEREGLSALWAAARIRDLELAEGSLEGRRRDANKQRIVALSVEHQVASKYASFVVVEKRTGDRRANEQPEARPVPVHAPAGWAMVGAPATMDWMPLEHTLDGFPGGGGAMKKAGAPVVARAGRWMTLGIGAPPPPPAAAKPAAPARRAAPTAPGAPPAMQRPAAPAPAPKKESFADKLKHKVQDFFSADEEAAAPEPMPAAAPSAEAAREASVDSPFAEISDESIDQLFEDDEEQESAPKGGDPLQGLFERQLASGLWEGDGGTDEARLSATAIALEACAKAGVDTSHPIFGAQVRKAVEAITALALTLSSRAGVDVALLRRATAAALAAASGRRLREQVEAAVKQIDAAHSAV